uniref:5'-nucleotidase n=1 Tax=Romanomermis culicivorax TaxID=13658 RepID=A0A915JCU6_ROMCU
MLKYDAMSFGNHEFDDGLQKTIDGSEYIGLAPYLKEVDAPFVCSNIKTNKSEIDGLYQSYRILLNDDPKKRVGVVGYVTPETSQISHPGARIKFLDEIESLKIAVAKLNALGVKKIVAVGHSGYDKDKEICRKVPGVDVVVGGHTNSFLYSGEPPVNQTVDGDYPTVVKNLDGSNCLVVQSYAYGKYLGFLEVEFDDETGEVKNFRGNPMLMNNSYEDDPTVVEMLAPYQKIVDEYQRTVIGKTAVTLVGNR